MIYVVLGMHKSGTTLVARLLHDAGIAMVETAPETTYDDGAFYERQATYDVNLDLLGWPDDRVLARRSPSTLRETPTQAHAIRDVITEASAHHEDWGFKDPRTCLTYAVWQRHLPDHRLIVVYRPVEDIWPRYRYTGRRVWKRWQRAIGLIRTWREYNQAVLSIIAQTDQAVLLLSYRHLISEDDEMQRLADFIGRPLVDVRDRRITTQNELSGLLRAAHLVDSLRSSQSVDDVLHQLEETRKRYLA